MSPLIERKAPSPRRLRRLRRSQSICRDVGAGCATLKAFATTSAQVAPLSKHLPRRLRRLRNSQSIGRDVCAGCATLKAVAATSAQVAPLSKHLPRRLRRLRNSQSICHDIGAGCAALKAFAATSAITLKQFLPLTYNYSSLLVTTQHNDFRTHRLPARATRQQ